MQQEATAPFVTEWMKFYESETTDPTNPEARYVPRAAMVAETRPDGFYDVLVVSTRADLKAGHELLRRVNNCRFYDSPTVLANRLGDGGWDWTQTGNKFICREAPEVVARNDPFARAGNRPPEAPAAPVMPAAPQSPAQPQTPQAAPTPAPEPVPQTRTVFPPPPPPEPGEEFPPIRRATSTMRVNRKPGAPKDDDE